MRKGVAMRVGCICLLLSKMRLCFHWCDWHVLCNILWVEAQMTFCCLTAYFILWWWKVSGTLWRQWQICMNFTLNSLKLLMSSASANIEYCVGAFDGILIWISKPILKQANRSNVGQMMFLCSHKAKFKDMKWFPITIIAEQGRTLESKLLSIYLQLSKILIIVHYNIMKYWEVCNCFLPFFISILISSWCLL